MSRTISELFRNENPEPNRQPAREPRAALLAASWQLVIGRRR
ncbi:MAG TPA: hypothetical protein VE996_10725 [Terriglobales bacterium]|nr:hypothetical protein [Terriglobales bacterium]